MILNSSNHAVTNLFQPLVSLLIKIYFTSSGQILSSFSEVPQQPKHQMVVWRSHPHPLINTDLLALPLNLYAAALSGLSSMARQQSLTEALGAGGDNLRKQVPLLANIAAELGLSLMASVKSPTALSHSPWFKCYIEVADSFSLPQRMIAWLHSSSHQNFPSPGQSSLSWKHLPSRETHLGWCLLKK